MASADEDADAVLSDVEADDPVPIDMKTPSPEDVSLQRFWEVLAELDREKKAHQAVENSKNDLQVQFNRLKVLCHEAIKKRDECSRQREEAVKEKEETLGKLEEVSGKLSEEIKLKDEALRQKDEVLRQLEELGKAKESSRVELETGSSMLVSGIQKIAKKVSSYKDFGVTGLPRSNKYSGLPAVAYGVIMRMNEIVEELLKQNELNVKSRNEARELMEQRNYEIAIEISQLEATISGLREEVGKKTEEIESLKKSVDENNEKLAELESEFFEKQEASESEMLRLRLLAREYESKIESQRPSLVDQLNYVSRIHENMFEVMKIVDANKSSELSESLFLARETDLEENIRASLAGIESIYELSKIVVEKTRDLMEQKSHEVKSLNETISQFIKEKEQLDSLLRSALSRRMSVDLSSKTNELFKVAENGLRESGIDYNFSKHLGERTYQASKDISGGEETEKDEVYALASALEDIIKQSQLEIIDLKHSVEDLRAESSLYKEHVDALSKELNQWKQRVEELEEKEKVANENVEGLMMDITAAEEEITRWKIAAQQEAAAGKAVEQEYVAQLEAVRHELEEAKKSVIEWEKKLKFKEETAVAAMAARDAAEKSLRLADMRASRLRDRVEDLSHQLDDLDTQETSRRGLTRPRYICWPWQWLGLDFIGTRPSTTPQQSANEMELSEPLL
ncbi:Hypothetical predicted protein [Olea europaea subsp. europaea]|uniref:Uncharacterized protein n=1 Tax=Olea europaea subsp. europaea TaxID=158383 RepID=A0A8S0Q8S6_OLEEU|nr:Hypothetical predicted protein [Olea europaea subsp. europaea]